MSRMARQGESESEWKPRTTLGMMVASGKIKSMEEIFENGLRIQEAEIVKHLLPDVKTQVVSVDIVQKQTDAGELTRFNALVALGNESGWFGLGKGKAHQMRNAIDKATNATYLNVIPVKHGCGSWECRCNQQHSIPFKVMGRGGSVTIELGIVAGEHIKILLKLAGIKDAWSRSYGSTSTMSSTAQAIFNALRNTFQTG